MEEVSPQNCPQNSFSLLASEKENVLNGLENLESGAVYWHEGYNENISYHPDFIQTNINQLNTELKTLPAEYFSAELSGFTSEDTVGGVSNLTDQQVFFLPEHESSFTMPF